MSPILAQAAKLKADIAAAKPCLGVFVKTPNPQMVELLCRQGYDFVALDAEHAPFTAESLEICILAAAAQQVPALVRVPQGREDLTLQALDLGAAGIIGPHVLDAAAAQALVASTRYYNGTRGFSPSGRSNNYGAEAPMAYRASSDASLIVLGQIEDAKALSQLGSIAAVEGLDALFIGPADLSVSLRAERFDAPEVMQAIAEIAAIGVTSNKPVGAFVSHPEGIKPLMEQGVKLFILSTDQSLMIRTAAQDLEKFKELTDG